MSGILRAFDGKTPTVAFTAFVADTAVLIGDVTVEEGASIWYGVVFVATLRQSSCTATPTSRTMSWGM